MRLSLKLVSVAASLTTTGAFYSEGIMLRRLIDGHRPGKLVRHARFRQRSYAAAPTAADEGVVAFRAAVDVLCAPVGFSSAMHAI